MSRFARLFWVLFLLIFSQSTPSLAQLALGAATMVRMPAATLASPTHLTRGSIYNQATLANVGGVAFELTATPATGIEFQTIELAYDPGMPDGKRLVVVVDGSRKSAGIHDWQLIPIARYADSPYCACFTAFGCLVDRSAEADVLAEGGKIFNYHRELDNTLLGLRLMQLDILLTNNDCIDLPRLGGDYILGAGESPPDLNINATGFNGAVRHLNEIHSDLGQTFRSYLISDYEQATTFAFTADSLIITGDPFFYCWRYRFDDMSPEAQASHQNDVEERIRRELATWKTLPVTKKLNERQFYVDQLITAVEAYVADYAFYSSGTIVDCAAIDSESGRRAFLDQYTTDLICQMLVSLRYGMAMYEPVFMDEFSRRLSEDPDRLRRMNPAVWDAATTTLRYSAFFRYVKSVNLRSWSGFLADIEGVAPGREIETPTVIWPSGTN